ncbi:hypothetical protein HDE_06806 [Halotydeus destructor]|nr:hypothetical protein HDE_06806 [Halotydeus destructor]
MGKIPTPRKGLRNTRASPLDAGDPVVENGENEDPFSGHEVGEMKNQIMNNLFSTKASDRERGALLFANLLQTNKDAVDAWFEKCSDVAAVKKSHLGDITRTLAPLLLDPKPSVRVAVAEALSRLSSISDLFAEVMVELDVMTPLQGCFERYFGDTSWLEKSIKFESQIYSYLCDILANLCARCPKALRKFNATSLSILLAKTLGLSRQPCRSSHPLSRNIVYSSRR